MLSFAENDAFWTAFTEFQVQDGSSQWMITIFTQFKCVLFFPRVWKFTLQLHLNLKPCLRCWQQPTCQHWSHCHHWRSQRGGLGGRTPPPRNIVSGGGLLRSDIDKRESLNVKQGEGYSGGPKGEVGGFFSGGDLLSHAQNIAAPWRASFRIVLTITTQGGISSKNSTHG